MKTIVNLLAVLIIAALPAACSKESKDDTAKSPPPASTNDKPSGAKAGEADPAPTLEAVFGEYEAIRALLANDTGKGVAAHARRMKQAAVAVSKGAAESAKPHLADAAASADKLAAVDEGDLAAVRLAFGEVSKPLVALLASDPKAAVDYHTFECPMAKGYKQWIQPNAELENPYMGQKMLTCGAEVKPE